MLLLLILFCIIFILLIFFIYKYHTLQKKYDQLLEESKADAKVLFLQSKYASMGETVGNIAHQWKQPLNAIGSIQNSIKAALIYQGEISKEKLLYSVDTSFKLLQHLAETIDTFYSFLSQQNNARMSFEVAEELEKVRKITEYSFQNSNISLTFELEVNPTIQGNANEFTHAMLNIIFNAKDAFDGISIESPQIKVHVGEGDQKCVICISDNAGGIRLNPIEMVFDLHISTKESGSGLGLFMTKNIIENRFGGKISAENINQGACFTMELPYAQYGERFADIVTLDEKITLERINKLSHKIIELEEVEKALKMWSDIFKHARWGIAIYVEAGQCLEVSNSAFTSLYGYTSQEIKKLTLANFFTLESLPNFLEIQKKALQQGYAVLEAQHRRKNGDVFPVSIELIVVKDDNDKVLYIIANIWDLTEQKQTEENLLLKEFALDTIKEAVYLIDKDSMFHYVNEGACHALGYTKEELLSMGVIDMDMDLSMEFWSKHWESIKNNKSEIVLRYHRRKDGTTLPVEVSANYFEYNGVGYNLAVSRDITERIRFEEQKDNERMRLFFERQIIGMAITSVKEGRVQTNDKLCEILGYSHEELSTINWVDITHPEDRERDLEQFNKIFSGDIDDYTLEKRVIRKDQEIIYINLVVSCVRHEDGTVDYILALIEDITERKEMEEALVQKEREYRTLAENNPDAIFRYDRDHKRLYINPTACNTIGKSAGALIGGTPDDGAILVSQQSSILDEQIDYVFDSGESADFMVNFIEQNGDINDYHVLMVPELNAEGKVTNVLSFARNVTEIRSLEKRQSQYFAMAPGLFATVLKDTDGNYSLPFVSEGIRDVYGVEPEVAMEDISAFVAIAHPDDTEMTFTKAEESARTLTPYHVEYRINHPYKGIRWIECNSMPQRLPDGSVRWDAFYHDITERKEMEEALKTSEQKFRTLVENLPDNVIRYDKECRAIYLSPRMERVIGQDAVAQMIGKTPLEVSAIDPLETKYYQQTMEQVLASGEKVEIEIEVPVPSGEKQTHTIRFVAEQNQEGEIYGVLAIGSDITERKEMEEALKTSEQKFRTLIENATDNIIRYDKEARITYLNPQLEKVLGVSSEVLFGTTPTEYRNDGIYDQYEIELKKVIATGENAHTYVTLPDTGEGEQYHYIQIVAERDIDGNIIGAIAFGRDVTELTNKTIELQKSLEFNEGVIAAIPDLLLEVAPDGTYVGVWAQNPEILAAQKEILLGNDFKEILPPDVVIIALQTLKEVDEKGFSLGNSYSLDLPEGKRWFELSAAKKKSSGNYILLARDITQRKNMEEQMQEQNQFLDSLLNAIPVPVFYKDTQTKYKGVNKAFEEFYGKKKEEIIGKGVFDLFPPEQAQVFFDADADLFRNGGTQVYEAKLRNIQGVDYDVIFHKAVYSDNSGTVIGQIGTILDITERKQAQKTLLELNETLEEKVQERTLELQKSLEFTQEIMNTLPDILFEMDQNGIYLNVWARDEEFLATQKELLLGRSLFEVLSQEAANTAMQALQEAETKGSSFGKVITIDFPSGTRYFEESVCKKSSTNTFLVLSHDITEQKRFEKSLQEREEMFRAIVENSPDVISCYNLSMQRTYINPMMQYLLNKPLEDILGKTPREFSPLPDTEQFEKMFFEVIHNQKEIEYEGEYKAPWGESRWGNQRVVPMFDADKLVNGVMVIGRDMTERIETEKQLMMIEAAINSSSEAVYINDPSLTIIYVNQAACDMLGYTRNELLQMKITDIDILLSPKEIEKLLEQKIMHGQAIFQTKHRAKDGTMIDVEIVGNHFSYNTMSGFISVVKEQKIL